MTTATIQVFVCFLLLSTVIALYGADYEWSRPSNVCNETVVVNPIDAGTNLDPLWIILIFIAYIIILLTLGRYVFGLLAHRVHQKGYMEGAVFVATLVLCFSSVWFCQTLTVSTLLGGLCLGLIAVPRIGPFCQNIEEAMAPLVVGLFLPVFFALVGLKANFTLLDSTDVALAFLLFGSLWVTTFVGAIVCTALFTGLSFEGLYFSILVTCKGLTVLSILTICLSVGFITPRFYSLCVLYAILSCLSVSILVAFFQNIEARYRKLHPVTFSEEEQKHHIPRLLVIPETSYLAPVAATVAAWLANSLGPDAQILFIRLIDDLENLDMFVQLLLVPIPQSVLSSDLILGPSQVRWNGMRAGGKVQYQGALVLPNLHSSYHKLMSGELYGKGIPITHQIIGYDQTGDSMHVIHHALKQPNSHVIIVAGHPGVVLAGARSVLVVNSLMAAESHCSPFFNEFSQAIIAYWDEANPENRPEAVRTWDTLLDLLRAFTVDLRPSYDALCCMISSEDVNLDHYLQVGSDCLIPIVFEVVSPNSDLDENDGPLMK